MTQIVAVDIGGTHVRFALAEVAGGNVVSLGEATTMNTGDFTSLEDAWGAYGATLGHALPAAVAISFAGPVHGDVLKLTNNPWIIRPSLARRSLGVGTMTLINDFAAVGHAVAHVPADQMHAVCGPDRALPDVGTISVVGPGTGLGVAHVLKWKGGYHVNETEGGHIDFAPLDPLEDRIVATLRKRFRRVSAERIVSGPGLHNLYEVLADGQADARIFNSDGQLWTAAMAGSDRFAAQALERFCLALGAVAGDIALAQGGSGLVIAGGLGLRLADLLPGSGFPHRFRDKGRFEMYMSEIPVKVLLHPQPGLLGAAAAYAGEHRD